MNSPQETLLTIANVNNVNFESHAFASILDKNDPLREFRDKFYYPIVGDLPLVEKSLLNSDEDAIYLCGHSLGLMPKVARSHINTVMEKWSTIGIYGRNYGSSLPWEIADNLLKADAAAIVGGKAEEVDVMNGLTVNLHLMLIGFYQPTPSRYKILLEKNAFPSDHYVIESQARLNCYDPSDVMIFLKPRQGENNLRIEDILKVIQDEGDKIAVICLGGIQYYTGQLLDIPTITKAGQAKGCYVGWDLAHAVGNVELQMHDWNVDFAVWCSYKFLNTGAGGIAGAFLHERHDVSKLPKLQGWWGHRLETRFDMTNVMEESPGISAFRLTNPCMFQTASLRASLDVFKEAGGMKPLRKKSLLLTTYLELLLKCNFCGLQRSVYTKQTDLLEIITPDNPNERGCQLSVKFAFPINDVFRELEKRGVVCDERKPDVIRLAPVPLYNSFMDIYRFVQVLKAILLRRSDSIC